MFSLQSLRMIFQLTCLIDLRTKRTRGQRQGPNKSVSDIQTHTHKWVDNQENLRQNSEVNNFGYKRWHCLKPHFIGAIDCTYVICLPMNIWLVLSDHNRYVHTTISANVSPDLSPRHVSFNKIRILYLNCVRNRHWFSVLESCSVVIGLFRSGENA
jgi:hypothetical protein